LPIIIKKQVKSKVKTISGKIDERLTCSFNVDNISTSINIPRIIYQSFFPNENIEEKVISHKNRCSIDNRLSNLRLLTTRENTRRVQDGKGYASNYKGVTYCNDKRTKTEAKNPWTSSIKINNKSIYLGTFKTEEEASKVYQLAVKHIDEYDGNPTEFREKIKKLL
jgi:hypothetical protein